MKSELLAPPVELVSAVRGHRRLLLTSHANPDGDAIGSEIGLSRILHQLGKSATIWNADPVPTIYRALPGTEAIHIGQNPPAGYPEDFDAVIALECPTLDRSGLPESALFVLPLLNIDHHLGNGDYGRWNWVDSQAPAVGEMVLRLAQSLDAQIDSEAATALYLALASDTGGFRYSNATERAFRAAAKLVRLGASPEAASFILWEQRPPAMLRLLARMIDSLQLHHGGTVATAILSLDMFRQADATKEDSEGLIDQLRAIAGVQVLALLRQLESERFKISLRSRGDVDVEGIARRRGGGGHRNAAGCFGEGGSEILRLEVADELATLLEPRS